MANPILKFTLEEPYPTCGARRKRGKVECELPPDHGPSVNPCYDFPHHMGRGRDGRWLSWEVERG